MVAVEVPQMVRKLGRRIVGARGLTFFRTKACSLGSSVAFITDESGQGALLQRLGVRSRHVEGG